jgi:uncharacterized protein YndB with AHSA1/START domain
VSGPATSRITPDRFLFIERWFNAPPEKVYGAWTRRDMLERFFWPVGQGKVKEFDLKVGGRLVMGHADQPWTATWSYKEILPGRKLVFDDHWDDGSGHVATGTMEFLPENGGTRLKVAFGPFPTKGPYQPEAAAAGFAMGMDKLAEGIEVPGPGEGFRIVRHFQAPAERVWAMWTTKEGLAKWWKLSAQEMGYEFAVRKLDVRVGGQYDITMTNKEHGELHNHGTYTEVVPNRRLAQTWDFDIFLGPDEKPYPISVAIDLEEVPASMGGGTKMTFTQGPMARPEFTEGSRQGVIRNFAKLSQALEQETKTARSS